MHQGSPHFCLVASEIAFQVIQAPPTPLHKGNLRIACRIYSHLFIYSHCASTERRHVFLAVNPCSLVGCEDANVIRLMTE
jgi:hypothetical protein